jgi:hypothetical protein
MKSLKNLNKADPLVVGAALSNLFYSLAYPIVHTVTMQGLSSNWVSFASLANCFLASIITKLWLKRSKKLYYFYGIMLGIEVIVYAILTILFLVSVATPAIYYMGDAILSAVITRNIICGGTRLKALRYEGEEREEYDNKNSYYSYITSIIGFAISSFITFSTPIGFILMFVGIAVDNIFYYCAFKEEGVESNE